MQRRPQTTRKDRPSSNPLQNIDFSEFLQPYEELQKEYKNILHQGVYKDSKAYIVKYKNHPDIFYVAFANNRASAKWKASKSLRDNFNPFFSRSSCREEMLSSRAIRHPEFDKYAQEGYLIPIPKILKADKVSLPCSVCGKGHFTYSDYEKERCFVIEGEGNLNDFIRGYLLCYDCYKKYIK